MMVLFASFPAVHSLEFLDGWVGHGFKDGNEFIHLCWFGFLKGLDSLFLLVGVNMSLMVRTCRSEASMSKWWISSCDLTLSLQLPPSLPVMRSRMV